MKKFENGLEKNVVVQCQNYLKQAQLGLRSHISAKMKSNCGIGYFFIRIAFLAYANTKKP
jgi:hypothetical protein